jgi:hypothetical protein
MPTYEMYNEKTGEVKEVFCKYEEKPKILEEEGPDWIFLIGAPGLNYQGAVSDIKKAGAGWADTLKNIKANADPKECTIGHLSEDPD